MMNRSARFGLGFLLSICFLIAGGDARAQSARKHLALNGIPSAVVAPRKTAFAGLALTNKRAAGATSTGDGSAVLGYGFGSAEDRIGFEVSASITSLQNNFADSGYFSIKASRRIVSGASPVYASLGFDYLGGWGASRGQKETVTVAVTRFSQIYLGRDREAFPLMMTLGAGSGIRNNNTDPGIFFGVGLGVSKNVALSAAYTGETVTLGAGFRFDAAPRMNFGLSLDDAFNSKKQRRIMFTVGVSINNLFGG